MRYEKACFSELFFKGQLKREDEPLVTLPPKAWNSPKSPDARLA